jgi:hypothetical protein
VGWLIAIVVVPILFMLIAIYTVIELTVAMLRLAFLPLMLLRRGPSS